MRLAAATAVALSLLFAMAGGAARALPLPEAPNCPIFPPTSWWNLRVDALPVAKNSAAIIASIGLDKGLHSDFGSGKWNGDLIGIPITVVPRTQQKVSVAFRYRDESDPGPYPIPDDVGIEGGSDRHALIVDRDACRLYELFALRRDADGNWHAGSGAIWSLISNRLRPRGWTSADAAGLQILPGLARYDEVARGVIDHALRFTVGSSRQKYVYPARHYASSSTDPTLPPMGLRVRLKQDFDIGPYPPQARIVLQALKTYGMMVADNGSDWYISGEPSESWNNDDLHTLGQVKGSNFEVVDTSGLPKP